ncbi:MAG: hypothetical protein ACKO7Q_02385 [Actinomycetota bacterium]
MSTRTLLSIVLGLAVSVVAVGGLYWAGAREPAAADPSLELSSQARDAYGTGLDPAATPRLRTPEPAPALAAEPDPEWESAAPAADEQPEAWDEDDERAEDRDDHADEHEEHDEDDDEDAGDDD